MPDSPAQERAAPPDPRRRLERGTALTLARQGGMLVVGLGWAVLLARALGVEGAGLVAVGIVTAQTLGAVIHLGLPWSIAHMLARGAVSPRGAARGAFQASLLLCIALAPAAFAAAALLAARGAPGAWVAAAAGLGGAPAVAALAMLGGVLHGSLRFAAHALVSVLGLGLALMAGASLLVLGLASAWALLAAWIAAQYVVAVGLGAWLRAEPGEASPGLWKLWTSGSGFAWRLQAGEVAVMARSRMDHLILAALAGPGPVGLYFAASRLVERLAMVSQAAMFALFPLASRRDVDLEQTRSLVRHALAWSVGASTAGAVVLAAVAAPLVRALFGSAFLEAVPLLYILLPSAVALSASRVWTAALLGRGHPELTMRVAMVVAGVAVVLNLVWIPRWGAAGAAWAATTAAMLDAGLRAWVYRAVLAEGREGRSSRSLRG